MKRRATTSGKASRPRARKGTSRKSRPASAVSQRSASAYANSQAQLDRTKRELKEALEQQAATSAILKIVRSSPNDLRSVLDAIVQNAVRLCAPTDASLLLADGDIIRHGASQGDVITLRPGETRSITRGSLGGRAIIDRKTIHLHDSLALLHEFPDSRRAVERSGVRTSLAIPLLQNDVALGVIVARRKIVMPFTEAQIALLQTFAEQAVIAIENTRLLNELRQRTGDLSESLEQQTATADVLSVISSSPGDLEPVFNAMLENAIRICDGKMGGLSIFDGQNLKMAAMQGSPSEWEQLRRRDPIIPLGNTPVGRLVETKRIVHATDIASDERYMNSPIVKLAGIKTILAVPMLKEGNLIGAIAIYRQEVRSFTNKQIELVQNFAAQAVIAIENARLLNELRQRTDDLSEALEQQTATSEVLTVISRTPGELEPVFQAMLANAMRICEASFGILFRFADGAYRAVSWAGISAEFAEFLQQPRIWGSETGLGQVVLTKGMVQIDDARTQRAYSQGDPGRLAAVNMGGARTILEVPLLREGELIGAFSIFRQEVRPFTQKQIELVQNFAAQAVIAIENARLLNELRESFEQQLATSNVLQTISRSAGELSPVFKTMLENATRLCSATLGALYLRASDGRLQLVELHGTGLALKEKLEGIFVRPGPNTVLGRLMATRETAHIADVHAEPGFFDTPVGFDGPVLALQAGARTLLGVPMLNEDELVGGILIYRQEVRPFTNKQIELVQNFAAQAVIAIRNTRLLNELRQRTDDLAESLEQQTATSEVLAVVAESPGKLEPVFRAMLANAIRLCEAKFGFLALSDGDTFRMVEMHSAPSAYTELWRSKPLNVREHPLVPLARLAATRNVIHFADIMEERGYIERDPWYVAAAEAGGVRTILAVPMLKENELVGAFVIFRQEVRSFSNKQIDLVSNFAAQAVIAIENTRLLNELRQRTDDLSEALEQQTATADVLKVISGSPGELEPVFNAMLENATRICEAKFGALFLAEGDAFRTVALHGAPPAFAEARRREPLIRPGARTGLGRVARTKRPAQIADIRAEPDYANDPARYAVLHHAGARTMLTVPMLKEGELVGQIGIYRQEVRPFTDKQIVLLTNFAAQAVIAIENTRLLNELRDSLEQQTATSEVLQVISSSPGELESVFNSMLENATRICQAKFGFLFRYDGNAFHTVAQRHAEPALAEFYRNREALASGAGFLPAEGTALKQVLDTRAVVCTVDQADVSNPSPSAKLGGARSHLAVPMLKDDQLVGVITIYRTEVLPFTEKQIELVKNFAAQAVIAIENTRLLSELRESLQQQTATADVLKVISRSTFDLQNVLNTLVESAARLCDAHMAAITRQKDGNYHILASYGFSPGFQEYIETVPLEAGRRSLTGRVLLERKPIHIIDVLADAEYTMQELVKRAGIRTMLGMPLLREGIPIGTLLVSRAMVKPFTDKQIELVTTFADQAVIAIENVRLFDEIQDKSRQLAEASQHKSQFLANMSHELRTPLNAILGYTELISDGVYGVPPEKMLGVLKRVESNGKHLLGLINAVLDLSKIEAGQLFLDLTDYSLKDVVQTVCAAVEALAADKKLALKADVSADLPTAHGDERRLTQVLLNLMGNAIKFTDSGEVIVEASAGDGVFNVSVRDTGPGISAADQAKLFQEFQQADNSTTRKKGGTGLGLAISKRIIEMHGGKIWIESKVGQGATFSFTLPVRAEDQERPN